MAPVSLCVCVFAFDVSVCGWYSIVCLCAFSVHVGMCLAEAPKSAYVAVVPVCSGCFSTCTWVVFTCVYVFAAYVGVCVWRVADAK